MNQPIQKPIKRLAENLLKDSEQLAAMIAVTFLENGDVRAHGAGLVSQNPEMAIYGAARMLFTLLSSYEPEDAGSLTISLLPSNGVKFEATGEANKDPRATLFLIGRALQELTRIIHEMDNVVADNASETQPSQEQSPQETEQPLLYTEIPAP
jgi:hypothetical protein